MSKTSWQVKKRYNDKAYDNIKLILKKGQKEKLQKAAAEQGISTNRLIVNELEKYL